MFLFAADLDNTLIYSYKWAKKTDICIEKKEGVPLSYISLEAYFKLQKIREQIEVIPITTRSLEQYKRIEQGFKKPFSYALVSNGGILLKDGQIDNDWLEETKEQIADCKEEIETAYSYLEKAKERSFELRRVDNLFLFTKSKNPQKTIKELKAQLDLEKIIVKKSEKKIYVMPKCMTKGLALERIKKIFPKEKIVAAGDNIDFDLSMLKVADTAITLKEKFFHYLKEKENTYYWNGKQNEFPDYILSIIENYMNNKEYKSNN